MINKFTELIKILNEIKGFIDVPNSNIIWSRYVSVDEALKDVDLYIERAKRHDSSVIRDLKILFSPTGAFQEISINSGWGYDFIEISSRFDKLSESFK